MDAIDDDPYVPAPNYQIAWMWRGNTPKIIDSCV
jgi:hypothetical protein